MNDQPPNEEAEEDEFEDMEQPEYRFGPLKEQLHIVIEAAAEDEFSKEEDGDNLNALVEVHA